MNEDRTINAAVSWQGFNHIAVATPDLDATIRFYQDVLGMEVGEIYAARGGKTRHCFIKPGTTAALGLHFWEVSSALARPQLETLGWQQPGFITAGDMLHIAFTLPDEAAGLALRERLSRHAVRMDEINDLGEMRSFVFLENNGVMLEAIWLKA